MGLLHCILEALDADVGVDLGGRQTFVTEKLLNRFEIGSAVQ